MFYDACWYDLYLNHMTQPDAIVQSLYSPKHNLLRG